MELQAIFLFPTAVDNGVRQCVHGGTVERLVRKNERELKSDKFEHVWSAVDHHLAELTMGMLFNRGCGTMSDKLMQ
ncbi:Hha/YmoA family nucleoid-associated regulatory protein [Salmonella enterica]|uniref:Hha/YmoA family nucleoid-associated regulatory protein n=1 Tax=Salmonella enterica TaxID=28901 RepID=UPI00287BB30F|nr:Hha/YmoA family nucleoid-associated regulatory protein [Salmonella enterica]